MSTKPPKKIAFDTSCVINLLSLAETPNDDLQYLMRVALEGRTTITTTPFVEIEIPDEDVSAGTPRGSVRERLASFPQDSISAARLDERDQLADGLMRLLWPRSQRGSRTYRHNLLDCKHLASHQLCGGKVFVTLDANLLKKTGAQVAAMGVDVAHPSEIAAAFRQEETGSTNQEDLYLSVVRRAKLDDGQAISELLEPIKSSYPDFDGWWTKANKDKSVYVGVLDGEIAGVAVWARKDDRVVKLSTFYVREDRRGQGLGPHLLFHQIRLWVEGGYEKVYVTIAADRLHVLPFFLEYGFRIEGASSRRYKSGATEFIVSKHLFYERVTDDTFVDFLGRLEAEVFSVPGDSHLNQDSSWFMPPRRRSIEAERDQSEALPAVHLRGVGDTSEQLSVNELEELIYPARLALSGRLAFMIPIRPQWADHMMAIPRDQVLLFDEDDRLRLRTDNAYYCYPRYGPDLLTGAPVVFYVSSPDKKVAGFARILECDIAAPEELYNKYGGIGIYGLEDIRNHVKESDCTAMALRFGWWVPFACPIGLKDLSDFGLSHPMTITEIGYEPYEKLLSGGGIKW